jgi:HEAT repeat protein
MTDDSGQRDRDPEADVERHIADLVSPFGGPPHHERRERALAFLLDHAERAYPRLLATIAAAGRTGPAAVLRALPLFGRAESIPVLRDVLLEASDATVPIAADALATHPGAAAEDVLITALDDARPIVIAAAADALHQRGAARACAALRRRMSHSDPDVRLAVLRAAGALKCLTPQELADVAARDDDETVRRHARALLGP